MNLKYMKVSLFEITYKKKWTFSRHSNLLRCTCIYFFTNIQNINWWTGVIMITCGLLWCFYQLFELILMAPIQSSGHTGEQKAKTNSSTSWMTRGRVNLQPIFNFEWTIPASNFRVWSTVSVHPTRVIIITIILDFVFHLLKQKDMQISFTFHCESSSLVNSTLSLR